MNTLREAVKRFSVGWLVALGLVLLAACLLYLPHPHPSIAGAFLIGIVMGMVVGFLGSRG